MKRHPDLYREILLQIEEKGDVSGSWIDDIEVDGFTKGEITYHSNLLYDSGLIKAYISRTKDGLRVYPTALTDSGHDFLDKVREPRTWNKVKTGAGKLGWELTLNTIPDLVKRALSGEFNHLIP